MEFPIQVSLPYILKTIVHVNINLPYSKVHTLTFLIQTWLRGCDVTTHIMVTYITVTISHDQKKFIEGSRTNDVMQHSYNMLIL